MDDMGLCVKIMESTHDHPNDRPENIGRKGSPLKAILQHPQRFTEGFEDHADMVSPRPNHLEGVKQGADKVPALMGWVRLCYALCNL